MLETHLTNDFIYADICDWKFQSMMFTHRKMHDTTKTGMK